MIKTMRAGSIGHAHSAAGDRRAEVAEWLRKKGKQEPRAARLAGKLGGCMRRRPCGSLACTVCAEALQHDVAAALGELIGKRRRDTVVFITVALTGMAVPTGGLAGVNMQALRRRIQYALDKAGVGWAVGALDYSFNEHKTGRYAPCWLVHLHLVTATDNQAALRGLLQSAFPRSDAVPRPAKVLEWDGRDNALLYLLKTEFGRRVGVDDAERFSPKTGAWRRCRATSQQRLRSAERLELLLHLDGIGPEGRVFMRKAQLRRTREGLRIAVMR